MIGHRWSLAVAGSRTRSHSSLTPHRLHRLHSLTASLRRLTSEPLPPPPAPPLRLSSLSPLSSLCLLHASNKLVAAERAGAAVEAQEDGLTWCACARASAGIPERGAFACHLHSLVTAAAAPHSLIPSVPPSLHPSIPLDRRCPSLLHRVAPTGGVPQSSACRRFGKWMPLARTHSLNP